MVLLVQAALIRAKTLMAFRPCRAVTAVLVAVSTVSASTASGGVAVSTIATSPTAGTCTTTTSSPTGTSTIRRTCVQCGASRTDERSSAHSEVKRSNGRCCERLCMA